jgi:hypothetical protein
MSRLFGVVVLLLLVAAGGNPVFAEPVGQAIEVSGDALVIRDSRHITLNKRLMLDESDIVVTRKGASARLKMNDDSELFVGPRSSISLQKYAVKGKTRIFSRIVQFWGKVRFAVSKLAQKRESFEVQTKTAVIGVRGTDFMVTLVPGPDSTVSSLTGYSSNPANTPLPFSSEGTATVTCTSGSVVVTNSITGQIVTLQPGETATINADGSMSVGQSSASSGESNNGESQDSSVSNIATQAASSAATSSAVIQGSTITTPYPYK